MKEVLDHNGEVLFVGAVVDVPNPTGDDDWLFEFSGRIIELDYENSLATVESYVGDVYIVECERLELI
jgi:hypothetical protein